MKSLEKRSTLNDGEGFIEKCVSILTDFAALIIDDKDMLGKVLLVFGGITIVSWLLCLRARVPSGNRSNSRDSREFRLSDSTTSGIFNTGPYNPPDNQTGNTVEVIHLRPLQVQDNTGPSNAEAGQH